MPVLGITGGIGMGKSAAAGILTQLGIPVVDTDLVARSLVEPDSTALQEIVERFGSAILDPAGALNRSLLAKIVFQDPSKRLVLEGILHPRIAQVWRDAVQQWKRSGSSGAVVIPLLFEKQYEREFDAVVSVACTQATQQERLKERGWNLQQIQDRIAAQLPASEKINRSPFVVWTEGTLHSHRLQWELILNRLGSPVPSEG